MAADFMTAERMSEIDRSYRYGIDADTLKNIIQKEMFDVEDLYIVGTSDLSEIFEQDNDLWNEAQDWFFNNLEYLVQNDKESNVEYWSDYDENYPNDTYFSGYRFENVVFRTTYSGVADDFWNRGDTYTICYDAFLVPELEKNEKNREEDLDFKKDFDMEIEL